MGEFDLSLIREFRSRPAFYDRNSPLFKDKVFTAHEWQVISNKLGYDVSLLKDRMLQLRNRYNLEKRRLEQLREENPGKHVESPWPLYNQLHFLSEHIRARRSYKRMTPLAAAASRKSIGGEMSDSRSNPSPMVTYQAPDAFPNGLLTVKMEDEFEVDGDGEENGTSVESENQSDAGKGSYMPPHQSRAISAANIHQHSLTGAPSHSMDVPPSLPPPSIAIRRLNTLREEGLPQKRSQIPPGVPVPNQVPDAASCASPTSAKQPCLSSREKKYQAFGSFMSSSLLELPQKNALLLVEKFTSEMVKVLIQKSEEAETVSSNGDILGQ